MCGIAGIFEFGEKAHVDSGVLRRMCDVIAHRGPDDDGFFTQGRIGLGMRRLSIVDLSTGHQPISDEDGSITVVFNGEIYNHRSLRENLITRGHRYRTQSDTETIVHLYEEYGNDCVQHLRGMFAFAIWDENKQQLLIARDRVGIKPLYYWLSDKSLVFGSEIKTLVRALRFNRRSPRSPIFQVMFGFEPARVADPAFWQFDSDPGTARYDLALLLNESADSTSEAAWAAHPGHA